MLCYVGKATKIFFFLVALLAAVAIGLGFGLLRHGSARKFQPKPQTQPSSCQGGSGNGPCGTITSFPDPATAAAVPPPPSDSVLAGPTATTAALPPPPPGTNEIPVLVPPLAPAVSPPAPAADIVSVPAPTATTAAAAPPPAVTSPPAPVPPAAAPPPVTGSPPSPVGGALGPGPA